MIRSGLAFLLIITGGFSAFAQSTDRDLHNKMDRLQRELSVLQRQLATGEVDSSDIAASPSGSAQVGASLEEMREEMRMIRGKLEENEFQIRRLNESFERMQSDIDFRFSELSNQSQSATSAAPSAVKPPAVKAPEKPAEPTPAKAVIDTESEARTAATSDKTTAGDGVLKTPSTSDDEKTSSPRELYNHAFRLLNETKYEQAAGAFEKFTQKYPKDPLVGNAYYWMGETYYIQRDYVTAADHFRQGFEVLPDGPKAPDNLLKLSLSLDSLGRSKESCIVLKQITTKFKSVSTSVTDKAKQEIKRLECN